MKKTVVYTILKNKKQLFPYPPLFDFEDIDYVCFTNRKNIKSKFWKICYREDLEEIEKQIKKQPNLFLPDYQEFVYLQENQILVKEPSKKKSIITVPSNLFSVKKHVTRTSDENGNYLYEKNFNYQQGEYLLTIGMPVSNQIQTIERCLEGLEPLRKAVSSELIIVDTGSTDGTIEVAKRYGAKIIQYAWCDNMSAVRNAAIHEAKGIWYMSVDDDEWFEDITEIIRFFIEGEYLNYTSAAYIQRNFLSEQGSTSDHFTVRMAKITPDLHFEGRIHDALILEKGDKSCSLNAAAYHKGFLFTNERERLQKVMRNCSLLQLDIDEFPFDLRYNVQLANEFSVFRKYEESVAYYIRGLSIIRELTKKNEYYEKVSKVFLLHQFNLLESDEFYTYAEQLVENDTYGILDTLLIYYMYIRVGERYGKNLNNLFCMAKEYEKIAMKYQKDPFLYKQLALTYYNPIEERNMQYEFNRCMLHISIWLEKKEAFLFLEELIKQGLLPQQRWELLFQIIKGTMWELWEKAAQELLIGDKADNYKTLFYYAVSMGGNVRLSLRGIKVEDLKEMEQNLQKKYPGRLKKIVKTWKGPYTEKEKYLIECVQKKANELEIYKNKIEEYLLKQDFEKLKNLFQQGSKIWDYKNEIEIVTIAVLVGIEEEERKCGLQIGILNQRYSIKEAVSFWRKCYFLLWRSEISNSEKILEEFFAFIVQEKLSEKALQYLIHMKSIKPKETLLKLVEVMMKDRRWKEALSFSLFFYQQYPKEKIAIENIIAVAILLKQDKLIVTFEEKLKQLELDEKGNKYVE